jgi:hypothetical protein
MHKGTWMAFTDRIGITDYSTLEPIEAVETAHKWLKLFCPERKSFKRDSSESMCLFDSIEGAVYGEKAIEEYSKHDALQYLIMDDVLDPSSPEIFLSSQKPIYDTYLTDFHVFPKNMAWCMSFTHEDGWIGPLFTKNSAYTSLQKKNKQAVEARNQGYA